MPDILGGFGSFPEAEHFFRAKANLPTRSWNDILRGQHAKAFTIAGATEEDFLVDMRGAVDAAISKGETLEDFRQRFDEIIRRRGWRLSSPEKQDNRGYRAWRTKIIYNTNLRTAYQAGRWETLKNFPYLKYVHNTINNPREAHKAWNGKIIATDDPWWSTHYPPNGWGCRCTAIGISAARLGKRPPDDAPPPIDGDPPPEWAYNVGVASSGRRPTDPRERLAEKWTSTGGRSHVDYGRPDQVPVDSAKAQPMPASRDIDAVLLRYQTLFNGKETMKDPSGATVVLSEGVVRHYAEKPSRLDGREQYLSLIQETIEDPFEIWVNFAVNGLGQMGLRRYYVKRVQAKGKSKSLLLIAEVAGGRFVDFDFFAGNSVPAKNRQGLLVWGRGE